MGESVVCLLLALRLLQFLPDSQDAPRHACDGSGDYESRVGFGRATGVAGQPS